MRALVMSGGGARGAFQVGVLQQLRGVEFDAVYGTSVGSLNACGMTFGEPDDILRVWKQIRRPSDVLTPNWISALWKKGIYSTKPLRSIVDKYMQEHPVAKRAGTVCYVDMATSEVLYKRHTEADFADGVEASCAMPVIMEPINQTWVDGGVREITPLKRAIEDGADEICVILAMPWNKLLAPWGRPKWPYIVSYLLRYVDVAEHEIFVNDINRCLRYNKEGRKNIKLSVYAPDREVLSILDFYPDKIAAGIEQGKQAKPIEVMRG